MKYNQGSAFSFNVIRFMVPYRSHEEDELMQYVFWVIPWRLSSKIRRFGTLYRLHLQGQVDE